jgi:hypothetical protein
MVIQPFVISFISIHKVRLFYAKIFYYIHVNASINSTYISHLLYAAYIPLSSHGMVFVADFLAIAQIDLNHDMYLIVVRIIDLNLISNSIFYKKPATKCTQMRAAHISFINSNLRASNISCNMILT